MSAAPIEIGTAARIRALLDSSAEPAFALHGTDLTADSWQEAEELLLADLADEVDRGESTRLREYQRVYRATRLEQDPSFEAETEKSDAAPIAPREPESLDVNETQMADLGSVMAGLRNGGLPFDSSLDATAPLPVPLDDSARSGMTAPIPRIDDRTEETELPFDPPLPTAVLESEEPREREPNLDETSVGGIDVKDLREALKHGR